MLSCHITSLYSIQKNVCERHTLWLFIVDDGDVLRPKPRMLPGSGQQVCGGGWVGV